MVEETGPRVEVEREGWGKALGWAARRRHSLRRSGTRLVRTGWALEEVETEEDRLGWTEDLQGLETGRVWEPEWGWEEGLGWEASEQEREQVEGLETSLGLIRGKSRRARWRRS